MPQGSSACCPIASGVSRHRTPSRFGRRGSLFRAGLAAPLVLLLAQPVVTSAAVADASGRAAISTPTNHARTMQDKAPPHAAACTGLPPSTLEIYDVRPTVVQRVVLDRQDTRTSRTNPGFAPAHAQSVMLAGGDFVILVNVQHRVLAAPDGAGYCDAPSKVRLGIGYSARRVYMTRSAAADPCVRATLMAHADMHFQAENELLARFPVSERDWFGRRFAELKKIAAPTPAAMRTQFLVGSVAVTREARQRFLRATAALTADLDRPDRLLRLNAACGGRVGQLEQPAGPTI